MGRFDNVKGEARISRPNFCTSGATAAGMKNIITIFNRRTSTIIRVRSCTGYVFWKYYLIFGNPLLWSALHHQPLPSESGDYAIQVRLSIFENAVSDFSLCPCLLVPGEERVCFYDLEASGYLDFVARLRREYVGCANPRIAEDHS